MEKNLPAVQETCVQSLDWEDPHGNPLQYFCLENFIDREIWWAKVHGVTKSWTRLGDKHFHFKRKKLIIETVFSVIIKRIINMKYSGISLTKFLKDYVLKTTKHF